MRRRTVVGLVAAAAAVTLVTTASIVWPGLDAKETPPVDASVWALQTSEGRRYARVNTAIGELDTVRSISNPDRIAHSADATYLFSDSLSKVTRIDESLPVDLDDEALSASRSTPPGTVVVATAGDFVAYLTDAGTVFAGRLSDESPGALNPFAEGTDGPSYTAEAIAVDDRGILFAYSRSDASVMRWDIASSTVVARDELSVGDLTDPAITAAGDDWAVVDAADGMVWRRGQDSPGVIDVTGALVVGEPDAEGEAMYAADERSLVRIPGDGSPLGVDFTTSLPAGVPAKPVVHDGDVYGAWLGSGDSGGILWREGGTTQDLDYGDAELGDQRRPTFVEGRDSILLNETRSGWAWTIPDGELVASSQDWSLDDRVESEAIPSDEQLPVLVDPKPPIAEPDTFGVRAGSLAALPVLMNDHDPNEDVLSIDAASVTGLDPAFGTVTVTDDGQRLAVRVAPAAQGTATLAYAVTDGTAEGGLRSPPTTVTLTVAGANDNSAPQWCAVPRCLLEWPEPEVARGGTVTVPVLPGWVDPEGDPILLLSAVRTSGNGKVAATPAGDVVFQHSDDGSGTDESVEIAVTVADTRGATTTERLVIGVAAQPTMSVQSFAVVDGIGAGTTVDVAPHVTGTAGTISLESVRVLDDAPASATVVGGTTEFDFSARSPGTYRVDFTVTDGLSDASGTTRITVLPEDAPPQLATAPVVAFVHPQQDATIDVFSAVSNPTRRVLLLSDIVSTPDAGASLSVDAVGQHHLRVSGATATGEPGRLGVVRYTVSDGSEDEGASVEGEATVYLLPAALELAPIAVDDTVVVRAGAQVDIPVLENDISPSGGRPTLDPSRVVADTPDALAFASGDLLRYLAPDEPGEYAIEYAVYSTGAPALVDVATVRVEVLADEANRAPLPETLEGRVLSGQSTVIEFDPFGMDPDGDVVTLDRIVTQPERGSAALSADGASIVYSSVPGDRGQHSFTYRVIDQFGERGEATVRVGVLDAQSNPSPITYTDYVQVQAGVGNTIRVSPLANDVDPVGGVLTLGDVRPDVPEFLEDGTASPEFTRLEGQIRALDDDSVVIAAGTSPGTMSFLYDLESSSGNTGRGLIVVKIVRESVPDYPVISDTILTAETRDDFPTGVDVLTGKVAWSGGDAADLELSLWGDPRGIDVDGWELSGSLPARTRIIPFAATAEGTGGDVTTYAFLRVPGDDELTLALRSSFVAPEAVELESITFDMQRLVAGPRGSSIEVGDQVAASGARADSTCALESGTTVRYDAGAGAPWTDACRVPVRIQGQDDWTFLSVPIQVTARDPQPILRAASLTVSPGETATYELRDLTTWQLRDDWENLVYALDYSGTSFDVSLRGSIVTVTAADAAVTGTDEAGIVSVTSHAAVDPVRLILRVGPAPSTLPRGGAVVQQCSQANGASCTIDVVGGAGEINPLPRTPLQVVGVRDAGACVGVTFTVSSSRSVTAAWAPDAPGATCTVGFTLQDAQARRTGGEREGRLTLDLLGYPQAPASVAQTGYADGSLTLRVDPGSAQLAYPAISGFVVRTNGAEVARCSADGTCPPIPAPNGERRVYEVTSLNAVGASRSAVRTAAWAYDPPAAPTSVTARPVPAAPDGGVVALTIEGIDVAETGSVEISSPSGEVVRVPVNGTPRLEVPMYRVGTNTSSPISVTPYSRFELPPGLSGTPTGTTLVGRGNGVGAPVSPQLVLESSSQGDGTSTVSARATAQSGGDGSSLRYGIVPDGARCTVSAGGATATFPGLRDGEEYRFVLCVESFVGDVSFGRTETAASVRAQQAGRAPRGYTFVVDSAPDIGDGRAQWIIRSDPQSSETPPNRNRVQFEGFPSGVFGADPLIRARYVHEIWQTVTPWSPVSPRAGSAPYQVQASWSVESCVGGGQLVPRGSSSNAPDGSGATIAFGPQALLYYDVNGVLLPHEPDTWTVPVGAVYVEGIAVSVQWLQPWGLAPASTTFGATCNPNIPPPVAGG